MRIPFEEGPSYLFKGGFPIAMNQFMYWTIFMAHYNWLKNKLYLLWVYNDFNYDIVKFGMMGFSHALASIVAYPAYFTREMVDIWPKERGGFCTWNNNYRNCFKWMIINMDQQFYNWFRGFGQWQKRYGVPYFIAVWMADNLGMMSNCNEAYNSLETQFPISSEYV
jgi:hypothetical protein